MVNPITAFIKGGMQSAADDNAEMVDRVAEWVFLRKMLRVAGTATHWLTSLSSFSRIKRTSINAQKLVDERHGPSRRHQFWREERRSRGFDHFCVAHSSLKASEGGYRSSIKAMRYYIDEAEQKRDAILEKYDKKQLYQNEKRYGVN